jgi:hypothetical protein
LYVGGWVKYVADGRILVVRLLVLFCTDQSLDILIDRSLACLSLQHHFNRSNNTMNNRSANRHEEEEDTEDAGVGILYPRSASLVTQR